MVEVRDHRRPGWLWADRDLIKRDGAKLGPHAITVYIVLCSFAGETQIAWPSKATIAKLTGCSRRQVGYSIDKLELLGWIKVERRPTGKGLQHETNVYYLLETPGGSAGGAIPSAGGAIGVVQGVHGGSARGAPEVEPLNESHKKKTTTTLTATPSPPPQKDKSPSTSTPTPQEKPAPKSQSGKPHPIKDLLVECEVAWGYKVPNGGKESKAAKALLKDNTQAEIVACVRYLQSDPWWADKHVGLQSVRERIGPWKKLGMPTTNGGNRGQRNNSGRASGADDSTGSESEISAAFRRRMAESATAGAGDMP